MNKTTLFTLIALLVLLLVAIFQGKKITRLSAEVEQQKHNVDVLKKGEREYIMRDSTRAVELEALQLDKEQFETLVKEKEKQIEMIRAEKKKEIEYYSKLLRVDSFYITNFDTIFVDKDTCYTYKDEYISYMHCKDTAFVEKRDTIHQVISKVYKHKFLWWRWGVKGVSQDIWSNNPHTLLHFEEFVKVER